MTQLECCPVCGHRQANQTHVEELLHLLGYNPAKGCSWLYSLQGFSHRLLQFRGYCEMSTSSTAISRKIMPPHIRGRPRARPYALVLPRFSTIVRLSPR